MKDNYTPQLLSNQMSFWNIRLRVRYIEQMQISLSLSLFCITLGLFTRGVHNQTAAADIKIQKIGISSCKAKMKKNERKILL
jgi:hypothetical protein